MQLDTICITSSDFVYLYITFRRAQIYEYGIPSGLSAVASLTRDFANKQIDLKSSSSVAGVAGVAGLIDYVI